MPSASRSAPNPHPNLEDAVEDLARLRMPEDGKQMQDHAQTVCDEGQLRMDALAKVAKVLCNKRLTARTSEAELRSWIESLEL